MPQITGRILVMGLLIAFTVLAWGCGDPNATATYDPESRVHPADWLPEGHVGQARESSTACGSCHGSGLDGGISGVSCSTCHLGGPTSAHPIEWNGPATTLQMHGRYAIQNGTQSCRNMWCHGTNLQGVSQSGPSCNLCHQFSGAP